MTTGLKGRAIGGVSPVLVSRLNGALVRTGQLQAQSEALRKLGLLIPELAEHPHAGLCPDGSSLGIFTARSAMCLWSSVGIRRNYRMQKGQFGHFLYFSFYSWTMKGDTALYVHTLMTSVFLLCPPRWHFAACQSRQFFSLEDVECISPVAQIDAAQHFYGEVPVKGMIAQETMIMPRHEHQRG